MVFDRELVEALVRYAAAKRGDVRNRIHGRNAAGDIRVGRRGRKFSLLELRLFDRKALFSGMKLPSLFTNR
jgi:hypothetical protein